MMTFAGHSHVRCVEHSTIAKTVYIIGTLTSSHPLCVCVCACAVCGQLQESVDFNFSHITSNTLMPRFATTCPLCSIISMSSQLSSIF